MFPLLRHSFTWLFAFFRKKATCWVGGNQWQSQGDLLLRIIQATELNEMLITHALFSWPNTWPRHSLVFLLSLAHPQLLASPFHLFFFLSRLPLNHHPSLSCCFPFRSPSSSSRRCPMQNHCISDLFVVQAQQIMTRTTITQ